MLNEIFFFFARLSNNIQTVIFKLFLILNFEPDDCTNYKGQWKRKKTEGSLIPGQKRKRERERQDGGQSLSQKKKAVVVYLKL